MTENVTRLFSIISRNEELKELKDAYMHIINLPPALLINTLPDKVNPAKQLNEFLLLEIINAGKSLMEKIRCLDQIPHENKYNDLFQAILKLRLPLFNMNIKDQPRVGTSVGGLDAGSSDLIISGDNNSIALIEALVLDSAVRETVTDHISKCNDYLNHCNLFFIVVYYKGQNKNFNSVWKKYQDLANSIDFAEEIGLTKSFIDLTSHIGNLYYLSMRNILFGQTIYKDNVEVYHIFFNIG